MKGTRAGIASASTGPFLFYREAVIVLKSAAVQGSTLAHARTSPMLANRGSGVQVPSSASSRDA